MIVDLSVGFRREIERVCEETKPAERSSKNMELQEIDDRLQQLEKEIEELEGKQEYSIHMEKLLQQKEKFMLKVFICFF